MFLLYFIINCVCLMKNYENGKELMQGRNKSTCNGSTCKCKL